jgi:hypothetical protein
MLPTLSKVINFPPTRPANISSPQAKPKKISFSLHPYCLTQAVDLQLLGLGTIHGRKENGTQLLSEMA